MLSIARPDEVIALADRCVLAFPSVVVRRPPEVGSVRVLVRDPVHGAVVHLTDVLATSAEVEHGDEAGWALRLGDDRDATLAAAICDLAASWEPTGEGGDERRTACRFAIEELCHRVAVRQEHHTRGRWLEVADTVIAADGTAGDPR